VARTALARLRGDRTPRAICAAASLDAARSWRQLGLGISNTLFVSIVVTKRQRSARKCRRNLDVVV